MLIRKTQQPSDYPENQIHDAYNESTSDTYSCNYLNPVILYSNDSGSKGENITFSDNATKYFKIDIMYGVGINNLNCRTIYTDRISKTSNSIPLEAFWRDGWSNAGFMSSWYNISNTGLTYVNSIRYYFYNAASKPTIDNQNSISIYKIVGYK